MGTLIALVVLLVAYIVYKNYDKLKTDIGHEIDSVESFMYAEIKRIEDAFNHHTSAPALVAHPPLPVAAVPDQPPVITTVAVPAVAPVAQSFKVPNKTNYPDIPVLTITPNDAVEIDPSALSLQHYLYLNAFSKEQLASWQSEFVRLAHNKQVIANGEDGAGPMLFNPSAAKYFTVTTSAWQVFMKLAMTGAGYGNVPLDAGDQALVGASLVK